MREQPRRACALGRRLSFGVPFWVSCQMFLEFASHPLRSGWATACALGLVSLLQDPGEEAFKIGCRELPRAG